MPHRLRLAIEQPHLYHLLQMNSEAAPSPSERPVTPGSFRIEPFVGREAELASINEWIAADLPEKRRAAVLVGAPGRGKSRLLEAFQRQCEDRPQSAPPWSVQLLRITGQQQAAEAMEHMLGQMLHQYKRPVKKGPRDREAARALLKLIAPVGDLLAYFVRDDTRPGWQRFLDFARVLSEAVRQKSEDARLIFLIDPQHELRLSAPGDWIPLAERLPPGLRLIIAQRPDDTLVVDGDAQRAFTNLLDPPLADLPQEKIEEWYEAEFAAGHLPDLAASARRDVWKAAYARYQGYPLAHRALINVLAFEPVRPDQLPAVIANLPADVKKLLNVLYDKLRNLGDDPHRAALALQMFSMPTPQETWANASGLDPVCFGNLLEDRRFAYLFEVLETRFGPAFAPFHSLFGERLERALADDEARRKALAEAAWAAIEPALTEESLAGRNAPFFELSAAVRVAVRSADAIRIIKIIDLLFSLKHRLGVLDEAAADMMSLTRTFEAHPDMVALARGKLGIVLQVQGNPAQARQRWTQIRDFFMKLGAGHMVEEVQGLIDELPK